MRIGLFGGSFDPIHNAHLRLALDAKKEFRLDKVIFVPARMPPHKRSKTLARAEDRIKMIRAAIRRYAGFEASGFETDRNSTTYSCDTVRHFRKKYPKADIFFLIGSDSLNELKTWKNIAKLVKLCRFIVARRKGYRIDRKNKYLGFAFFTKKQIENISATKIRKLAQKGASIKKLVPGPVEKYISKRKLYR